MNIKKYNINNILEITSIISLLAFILSVLNNNFLWFSFTEGWYSTWVSMGSLSEIYNSGFPFPPIYLLFYRFIINISDFISADRYLILRLIGVTISFLNLYILFRILRNLGNNSYFSISLASCSLIIFNSMEALVSYDYTPFNGLLISFLAFFITEKRIKFNKNKFNLFLILRPLLAVFVAILLLGSKQSTFPIIFCFGLIYLLTRKSKLEIINFLAFGILLLGSYIILIGNSIGFESFFQIYTNAEYKGGLEKIIIRFPKVISNSIDKFNPLLVKSFFKETASFSVIVFASYLIYGQKFLGINKRQYYFFKLFIISLSISLCILLLPGSTNEVVLKIRDFRESGVPLIIIGFLASFASFIILDLVDNERKYMHTFLLLFGGSIILTNIMSGGTGAFDSFLIICVFGSLINLFLENFSNELFLEKINAYKLTTRFPLLFSIFRIFLETIKVLFLSLISTISFATMISIFNKGYQWWGITERSDYSFVNNKLSYLNLDKEERQLPGSFFMGNDQRNYSYRTQQILKNNTKKSALAFPNIPYFYEISQIKPFANIPLSWIDVTGIKASNEQVKQWEKEKPEVIVFNFMHTDVYDIQTLAFSNLEKKHSFLYLNSEIIKEVKKGNYIIVDSYLSKDSGYAVFTLVRNDIKKDKGASINQSEILNYFDIYYMKIKDYLIKDKLVAGYLPIICLDHKSNDLRKFQIRLLNENNIDCKNTGLGRIDIGNFKNDRNQNVLHYMKSSIDINLEKDKDFYKVMRDYKYSNHVAVFSYLLSYLGYQ